MRYSYNKISNKKYQTARYPIIKNDAVDVYIISRVGDRLDLLANQFYDDSSQWWIIADANNLGKGDLHVPPGIQIRIPAIPSDLADQFRNVYKEK